VFPISDNNPASRFPFINLVLIALNVVASYFLFKELLFDQASGEALMTRFALVPARDFDLSHPSLTQLIQPLTSMFVHGGILHLVLNMWSLWIFGDNIESAFGSIKYLVFYLLCGIAAAFTHSTLHQESLLPVVGASGAISGVMGAYMLLFPRARIRMFTLLIFYPIFFEIPAFVFLIIWFVGQLLSAGTMVAAQGANADIGGIAFFAHIGGFVAGLVLTPFFKKRKR